MCRRHSLVPAGHPLMHSATAYTLLPGSCAFLTCPAPAPAPAPAPRIRFSVADACRLQHAQHAASAAARRRWLARTPRPSPARSAAQPGLPPGQRHGIHHGAVVATDGLRAGGCMREAGAEGDNMKRGAGTGRLYAIYRRPLHDQGLLEQKPAGATGRHALYGRRRSAAEARVAAAPERGESHKAASAASS